MKTVKMSPLMKAYVGWGTDRVSVLPDGSLQCMTRCGIPNRIPKKAIPIIDAELQEWCRKHNSLHPEFQEWYQKHGYPK